MNLIKFGSDTKHRKQWFTGLHFSHPAKMHLSLQLWLIENFTKEGETILDPMAGSGTILVACSMGRNVITVELEDKFVQMQKGNWEKIQQRGCQLGYSMGTATILQGDARNLTGVLADGIITSPPYAEQPRPSRTNHGILNHPNDCGCNFCRKNRGNRGELQGYRQVDKIITSPPYAETTLAAIDALDEERIQKQIKAYKEANKKVPRTAYGSHPENSSDEALRRSIIKQQTKKIVCPDNIGNLSYGSIDAVISSPPYEGTEARDRSKEGWWDEEREKKLSGGSAKIAKGYQPDAIITSPPYEEAMGKKHHSPRADKLAEEKHNPVTYTDKVDAVISSPPYEKSLDRWGGISEKEVGKRLPQAYTNDNMQNIGNLKSESYLSAMLQVYQQCQSVLKDGGLMVLVVKNFIRNKQIVRLDLDTIKLCERAGFTFQDRWYRELASQSFWRTIYYQKYPDVEPIKHEDILVFGKGINEKDSKKLSQHTQTSQ